MPRGVKNTTSAPDTTEKATRPRLSAAEKAIKAVESAQKAFDVVDKKLRAKRAEAAELDQQARELKALLDYAKASPFLPTEAPAAEAEENVVNEPDAEPAPINGVPTPREPEPVDLPGAEVVQEAAEDAVASGEVVATDAPQPEEDDPFAAYNG